MKYNFLKENNTNNRTISEEIGKGDYDFFSVESFFASDIIRIFKIINIFISFLLNLLYIISYIKTKLRKKQPQKNNLSFSFILILSILTSNFLHAFSFLIEWMIYVENNYYELITDNNVYHIGGLLIGNPSNSMTMCSIQGLLMIFSSLSQDVLINIFFYFMDNTEIPDKTKLKLMLNEWHTVGVKWTEESITCYYDDVAVGKYNNNIGTTADWPYNQNFYIILNLAIGGNLGGTGAVDRLNGLAEFLIDYLRVYQ